MAAAYQLQPPEQHSMGAEPAEQKTFKLVVKESSKGPGDSYTGCAATFGAASGLGMGVIGGLATLPFAGAEFKECAGCAVCIGCTLLGSRVVATGVKLGADAVHICLYGRGQDLIVTMKLEDRDSLGRDQEIKVRDTDKKAADEIWIEIKRLISEQLDLKNVSFKDDKGNEITDLKGFLANSQAEITVTGTSSQILGEGRVNN